MPSKKRIKLDELELLLNVLKSRMPVEEFNIKTSEELSKLINKEFNVNCSERDVFLLYEPTLQEDMLDIEIFYKTLFQ